MDRHQLLLRFENLAGDDLSLLERSLQTGHKTRGLFVFWRYLEFSQCHFHLLRISVSKQKQREGMDAFERCVPMPSRVAAGDDETNGTGFGFRARVFMDLLERLKGRIQKWIRLLGC
jgi:hypothetical protein